MSRIAIPYITSLQFVPMDMQQAAQYESRHMDDYVLTNRLNHWQDLPGDQWLQPWRKDDVISMQFSNNSGPIQVDIIDCKQQVFATVAMSQIVQNEYDPDYYIYQSNSLLNTLADGVYFGRLTVGSPTQEVIISEPFYIAAEQPGTLLCEFSHYPYYENVIFSGGFSSSIRFHGILRKKPTAFKDTVYEDQDLNMVMVKSKPYRIWELLIGAGLEDGVPDWFEDKMGRILGCSSLKIDGRYYTKNEGSSLTETDERYNGVLYTYSIELREKLNRSSRYYDTVGNINEELFITLNSTSKGFGDTELGDSSLEIVYDVE